MQQNKGLFNDDIDLISIFSVFLDNFNSIFSIFLSSLLVVFIYFISAENLYRSSSLIEIKNDNFSYVPDSLSSGFSSSSNKGSIESEIEIYKSNETISDAIDNLNSDESFDIDIFLTTGLVRSNLRITSTSQSLLLISFTSSDKALSEYFLNLLNEEFINDRKNFARESSTAGRRFINKEIPRIKELLKQAEDELNNFKISTKTSDVIFDTNSRNIKLERLRNRINEIAFKELELKEFYRENHPIYLTLSEQKKLILTQIKEIEEDLPNIPSTQRTLENFKREVDIYSNVLRDLSSQELSLGMSEASTISNVRVINKASEAIKVAPRKIIFLMSILLSFLGYLFFLIRHLIGDKISNFDSLVDYVGKEKIIGELPFLSGENLTADNISSNVADELLNKTIYEITHSNEYKSMAIVSSRKDAGKTEISKRIFNKLKEKYKVCLLDLDYRKKGLSKELYSETSTSSFDNFFENIENFQSTNGSVFVPSLDVDDPPSFFASEEFRKNITRLKNDYEYVICDTPPWKLFVDAKIISKLFDKKIYIVCNQESSFKDLDIFLQDVEEDSSVRFFYNKFRLYFNFLWYKYQYPYYSRNYYYDYHEYSSIKREVSYRYFLNKFLDFIKLIQTKVQSFFK